MKVRKKDTEKIYFPITITVAMRRFALLHSKKMPGCLRTEVGSVSHFFNVLAKRYADGLGIKTDGINQ